MSRPSLSGQHVVVIGGTSGMGLAIARFAAEDGARVLLAGRDAARAGHVAAEIGHGAEGRALDAGDEAAVVAFFEALGPIDHLVVTAAQARMGACRESPVADARATFEGKFWTQYLCARQARARRSILLFSGILSRRPSPGTASVAAVNGAIESLGRALAVELAPVRVNVISPGLVRGANYASRMGDEAAEAMYAATAARLPARTVGDADAVATVALAALESPYLTGAVLDVDGGGLLV